MKSRLAYFLAVILLLSVCMGTHPTAYAEEAEVLESGDYRYSLQEDGTALIVKYWGNDESVTIPSELDGYPVTSIGYIAFMAKYNLDNVVIPDSVTSIGDSAFAGCPNLTTVVIPNSVKKLGDNPFSACRKLTHILVSPDNPYLTAIDGVLFGKTDKKLLCYSCAFDEKEYTVPDGIVSIGNLAFAGCSNLAIIDIPESLTSIGDEAFSNCDGLTTIYLPDSVKELGDNPFSGCDYLTHINVSADNSYLATIDGVLFSKADKRLVCYPCAFDAEEYSVPNGINSIGNDAFYNCSALTTIVLPDSVTEIGEWAFYNCENLTNINLPGCVPSIGDYTFHGCSDLSTISLPSSVISIGKEAFSDCSSLTTVALSDSVTNIGDFAFDGCPNLTITVSRESYARQYCIDNNLNYTYPDSNDWLNN